MSRAYLEEFDYLAPEHGFLEAARFDARDPKAARAVVIPFGLESSVTYGSGTSDGPAAILAASDQLELFDDELQCEPCHEFGVATLKPVEIDGQLERALIQLETTVSRVVSAGRFPLVLGGEHALTAGAVRPFVERFDNLVVVQIDAHADLRDGYLGQHYSHAAVMRRVLDAPVVSLMSFGIRALSIEERDFFLRNRDRIDIYWGRDIGFWDWDDVSRKLRGRPVYLTFDVDGLDASEMPATGTPVPGGLSYRQAMDTVRRVAAASTIVGADVVELAPISGFHAYDFTAASVAYKILSYALTESR
ncbi:MAG: agmatinase [Hyphomicrobiaceae bacterium]